MKKRFLSIVMSFALACTLVPAAAMPVLADTSQEVLDDASARKEEFAAEYDSETGVVSWNTLIRAVLAYNAAGKPEELTSYYAGITKLDLSNQAITASIYSGTDVGSLAPFTGVTDLNLSNTNITDIGGLLGMNALKNVDLSGNALTSLGALANKTTIENLNISNTGATHDFYGAVVTLSGLKKLDISRNTSIASIGPLTTNGSSTFANTLEELNISGTGLQVIQEVWNGTKSLSSLPALKTLYAQNLTLTSISGLVMIVNTSGFSAEGITWDLTGSSLTYNSDNASHVNQIKSKFGSTGSFAAPNISDPATKPESVTALENWTSTLTTALGESTSLSTWSWDQLITLVYWYRTAASDINKMSDGETKTAAQKCLTAAMTAIEKVTSLDMSGKKTSQYEISTGALTDFVNLTSLNLSDTGIAEVGGLAKLTKLETLNLSKNSGINNTAFGAFSGLTSLTTLNLSETGITDLGGLPALSALTSLDISGTKVTKLQNVPNVKAFTAKKLSLVSITGMVLIATASGFSADEYNWDFTDSTLTDQYDNSQNIKQITNAFGTTGMFTAPTLDSNPTSVNALKNWAKALKTDLGAGTKLDSWTWDKLITLVYWYRTAQSDIESITDLNKLAICKAVIFDAKKLIESVTELDMSDKNTSKYEISTGALTDFANLTTLNLTNTGISDVGGLTKLTKLEALNLSKNTGIDNKAFGAITQLNALKTLDLSGTGVTDLGGMSTMTSLESLDVSETGITLLQKVPTVKTFTAKKLALTSITGMVKITDKEGFSAAGYSWDFTDSTLTYENKNAENVEQIKNAFSSSGTFKEPTMQKFAGSISYATTSISKQTGDAAFTNALTITGDGTVSYSSSNTGVATVDASSGQVTVVGSGSTTITAMVTDGETYTYETNTATYSLTVSTVTPSTPTPAHTHTIVKVEAKEATCTEDGNIEYYKCSGCTKIFSDAEGKTEITDKDSVVIKALGHKLTEVPAKAATCGADGNIAYWVCETCGKYFSDAEGKNEIADKTSVVTKATGLHTIVKVEAKEATYTEPGTTEHYECSVCGKCFGDAEGKTELDPTSVVVPSPARTSIAKAEIAGVKALTYTGKALTQKITVTLGETVLTEGTDYEITYADNTNAGTATVTVTGINAYKDAASATFTIKKAANPLTRKVKTKTYKRTKLTKAKTFKIGAADAQGKVTYTLTTAAKKAGIKVSTAGKVTVPKNCTAGTYKIKVKAAGNDNYKTKTLTVTVKVVKVKNTIKAKVTKKTYKRTKLTKAKTFKIGVTKAKGKVTYTLTTAAKKAGIKVTKKGKVTVPKNCKKGTYKIKVKAAGNKSYKAKTITVKVIVK